jgi:hypothetical protein
MFQVPISAPTASRMKMALIADETPSTMASATCSTLYPFLKAIRLAKAALRSRATCKGPSVAATPNRAMVRAIRPMSTTMGSSASSSDGGRGPGDGGSVGSTTPPAVSPGLGVMGRPPPFQMTVATFGELGNAPTSSPR